MAEYRGGNDDETLDEMAVPLDPTEQANTHHKKKDMVASSMAIGLDLLPTPPLGLNRVLVYVARLSRLDRTWSTGQEIREKDR